MTTRLPPLRLFTVFEAVARTGSFQRAASELNVTQPAVSQAIRALEDHVGAELIARRTRPVTLTEAGRILEGAVTVGLGRIHAAIEEIGRPALGGENAVTIACSVGTATYWLMPRLADFYQREPTVSVNVMTTSGAADLPAGADLAIRYGLGHWPDGAATLLFPERLVAVCSPALAETVRGLAGATLLHVVGTERSWLGWDDYLRRIGHPPVSARGRSFTNYVQATQAALSGQGILLGWESNAGDLVREGRLVPLDLAPLVPEEAFHLVRPHDRPQTPAGRLLADWLTDITASLRTQR